MITDVKEIDAMTEVIEAMYPGGMVPAEKRDEVERFIYNQRRCRRAKPISFGIAGSSLHAIFASLDPENVDPRYDRTSYGSEAEYQFAIAMMCSGIHRWKSQFPLGKYVLDFAFPTERIDVEIDGITHHATPERRRRDEARDRYANSKGWIVHRISAWESIHKTSKHLDLIKAMLIRRQPK